MKPTKILVTGATGFIGARLCELLSLEERIPYRALVRNYSRAARIARLDAQMALGDLGDTRSLSAALEGCDVVVNLAHADDRAAGEETRNIVAACRNARIRRFVHVSSMAVHGPSPEPEVLTEASAPIRRWGEPYSDAKAEAEGIVAKAFEEDGFPAVIVRPTVVYGPYSFFVTPIVDEARQGRVSLIDGGSGICNAVYVDDVCDAILAGIARDDVLGRSFFVNGDERLTWREFITTFAKMVPRETRTYDHPSEEISRHWRSRDPSAKDTLKALARLTASPALHAQLATVHPLGKAIRGAKELVSQAISPERKLTLKSVLQRRSVVRDDEPAAKLPSMGRVVREAYRSFVSNELAKTKLGWRPAHTFAEGAARTEEWLRFAHLLA